MSRLRVLHVLDVLRPSGAEGCLRSAARYWSAAGLDGEILSVGAELGLYAAALTEAGYRLHHIPQRPVRPFVPRYLRLLRERQPDVLHVHVERANFYLAVLARAAGVRRVVLSVHSVFPFEGSLRTERRLQRGLLRRLGATFVSVSESVHRGERENFGNPSIHLPNWFDDEHVRPPTEDERQQARAGLGCGPDDFVVASVGNCHHVKNHPAIIRALAQLPAAPPVRYLHAGGEEEGQPERRLAAELGVGDRTRFLGTVPDVVPVLHAADCYVMPSLREGMSIAALEAFGAGVPSVMASSPGLRDFQTLGLPVTWVETTPESVAAGIAKVQGLGPGARARLRGMLSAAARERFGTEQGARNYAELYLGTPAPPIRSSDPRHADRCTSLEA